MTRFAVPLVSALLTFAAAFDSVAAETQDEGAGLYNYYCYQCHGYSGDARTLASTYLDPQPRDFTRADPQGLTRDTMLQALASGRPGTAMVSFASVLTEADRAAVVDYIRHAFMQGTPRTVRYHTPENGWPSHERYEPAFPFATGEITLDTPWEALTPEQQQGKRLYMDACISCHDRAAVRSEGPVWELRALSYPRKHYSHVEPEVDAYSGASVFALHERAPALMELNARERRGERLYQENCAFCHSADGSGRNWIGSFLEPRPRNLTGPRAAGMSEDRLREAIRDGVPGTSMPAWRQVLDDRQIEDLAAYIERAFLAVANGVTSHSEQPDAATTAKSLSWRRRRAARP